MLGVSIPSFILLTVYCAQKKFGPNDQEADRRNRTEITVIHCANPATGGLCIEQGAVLN